MSDTIIDISGSKLKQIDFYGLLPKDSNNKPYVSVEFFAPKSTWKKRASFEDVIFSKGVHFWEAEFSEEVNFSGTTFSEKAHFGNAKFSSRTDFSSVGFSNIAHFLEAKFFGETYFSRATYSGDANFSKAQFSEKIHFRGAKFSAEADFFGVTFKMEPDFLFATFSGEANFRSTKFFNDVDFGRTTFSGETSFYSAEFYRSTYFSNLQKIEGLLDFSHSKFIKRENDNGKYQFGITNNQIQKADFSNATIEHSFNLTNTQFEGVSNFLGAKIDKANRETFRIIKHEFLRVDNKVEALKYQAKEMEAFREEMPNLFEWIQLGLYRLCRLYSFFDWVRLVIHTWFKLYRNDERIQKLRKEKHKFFEWLQILFNKYSNNYGTSWSRGVVFTLSFAIFSFLLLAWNNGYKFNPSAEGFGFVLKYVGSLFSLGSYFSDDNTYDYGLPKNWGFAFLYVLYLISRLLVFYGVYQTIAAFRKYGKGS